MKTMKDVIIAVIIATVSFLLMLPFMVMHWEHLIPLT